MPNAPSDPAVMARGLAETAHRVLDQAHPVRETTARVVPMATAPTVTAENVAVTATDLRGTGLTAVTGLLVTENDVPMVIALSAVIAQLVTEKSVNGSPVKVENVMNTGRAILATVSHTATAPSVRVLHAAIVPATRLVMGHVKGVATVNVVTMETVRNAAMAIVVSGSPVKAENVANTSLAILATASPLATVPMVSVLAVMRESVAPTAIVRNAAMAIVVSGNLAKAENAGATEIVLNGTVSVAHMATGLSGAASVVRMVIVLNAVIVLSMVIAHARMTAVSVMSVPN
jgi:hypothetical protein